MTSTCIVLALSAVFISSFSVFYCEISVCDCGRVVFFAGALLGVVCDIVSFVT